MFARYFFIVVGVISLLWIGYVAADIIDSKNAYQPTSIFGKEDGQLLIINRKDEVNNSLIPFKTTPKNNEILSVLKRNIQDERSIFISANQTHFLIDSKYHWTGKKVRELLKTSGLKVETTGLHSYKISGYEIEHYKNLLYFHAPNIKTTTVDGWGNFDRKASASIIDFNGNQPIITEIYFKSDEKIQFSTQNIEKISGKQINDKKLFAEVLPKNISNYHFLEKTYAKSTDQVFPKSPMLQWVDKGFVTFDFKGKKVLISDYILGQEPINILNDYLKRETENEEHALFKGIKLCADFPINNGSGFYLYSLNDYVIICEDQSICEDIITQNKLGNTLATDEDEMLGLFSGLPSIVSERVVNTTSKFSKAIYKNKILETRLSVNGTNNDNDSDDSETLTMNVDAVIKDFVSFDEKGNCVVLTATGELMYYSNGKNTWIKNLNSKGVGPITYIEQFQLILVTCKNSIHLLDRKGNYTLGGPIELGNRHPSQVATQYEWKGKLFLVFPDEAGNIIVYDSKRRLHAIVNNNMPDTDAPIDAWQSQKKLFYGIHNGSTFKMLDADRKKEYRSFALPNESKSIVKNNEIHLFANDNSGFVYIDQKGVKNQLNTEVSGTIKKTTDGRKDSYLSNYNNGKITVFGQLGTPLGSVNIDFSDLDNWDIQTISGRTFVSVIDGLENNVYLHDLDGRKLLEKGFEGSKKCMLNLSDNALILTTIIDNSLVQYRINY